MVGMEERVSVALAARQEPEGPIGGDADYRITPGFPPHLPSARDSPDKYNPIADVSSPRVAGISRPWPRHWEDMADPQPGEAYSHLDSSLIVRPLAAAGGEPGGGFGPQQRCCGRARLMSGHPSVGAAIAPFGRR